MLNVYECYLWIYVTSFSVFYIEATVSIGLKNVFRMATSILQY